MIYRNSTIISFPIGKDSVDNPVLDLPSKYNVFVDTVGLAPTGRCATGFDNDALENT
jgi:hypothetical protein